LVVGHRGAPLVAPENTLASFQAAVDAGAGAVEFDVRLTADDVPVVMHDPTVDRTTDGHVLVRSMTLDQVKRLRIEGSHEVPSLREALDALSGKAMVDIEVKNIPGEPDFDAADEPLVAATLRELDRSAFAGDLIIASFNPLSLARSKELAPEVPTGLLTHPVVDAAAALAFARTSGHRWVLPFVDRLPTPPDALVEEAHGAGVRVGVWIVDDPRRGVELLRAGVDAVATNDPAAVVAALRASGA
jgi:glycerophosphoryl diester phosphodiesterase